MSQLIFNSGRLRYWADDTTRTVTEYDGAGNVISSRPYTAEENAAADAVTAAAASDAAYETQRAVIKQIVNDLRAEKARAQTVIDKTNNQISGADTKDVARAAKRIADAAIDLARYVAP